MWVLPISRFAHDIYATLTHFITQNRGGHVRVVTFCTFHILYRWRSLSAVTLSSIFSNTIAVLSGSAQNCVSVVKTQKAGASKSMYFYMLSRCGAWKSMYLYMLSRCGVSRSMYFYMLSRYGASRSMYFYMLSRCGASSSMYLYMLSRGGASKIYFFICFPDVGLQRACSFM